jgi:sugar phosphate isomerase/epimerase
MTHPHFPRLPRSWKGRYPFRLGTTSYIYPADYIPNIVRLGPFVDEIELLMFASGPGDLPSRALIRELVRLGSDLALTYNVHLPTDICLGDAHGQMRAKAVETLQRFLERVQPLAASSHVVHLELGGQAPGAGGSAPPHWLERTAASLQELLAGRQDGAVLAVEVLDYPFAWVEPLIQRFGLGVCVDVGHLVLADRGIREVAQRHWDHLPILHLHGAAGGRDHLALGSLPPAAAAEVRGLLADFRGTVSLEVFDFPALVDSLECLEAMLTRARP